ncbi:MAG: hypothetical protein AAB495_04240 [Patescibacteria group bacterium]
MPGPATVTIKHWWQERRTEITSTVPDEETLNLIEKLLSRIFERFVINKLIRDGRNDPFSIVEILLSGSGEFYVESSTGMKDGLTLVLGYARESLEKRIAEIKKTASALSSPSSPTTIPRHDTQPCCDGMCDCGGSDEGGFPEGYEPDTFLK